MSIRPDSDVMQRNLRSLRAIDPFADEIMDHGLHVAVYSFNSDQRVWKREDTAGPFFIYKRKDRPWFSFIIVNRQNPEDFIQPILPRMNFELNSPYIFINKNDKDNIIGLWFTNESDCLKAHKLFEDLKSFSMLNALPSAPAPEKKVFIQS